MKYKDLVLQNLDQAVNVTRNLKIMIDRLRFASRGVLTPAVKNAHFKNISE